VTRRHRARRLTAARPTFSLLDEAMASNTEPLARGRRIEQLTRMWAGFDAMATAERPTTDDWRVCSDAVNLMESLVDLGYVEDGSKLLDDAVAALARAGQRATEGKALRLDGPGRDAVRAVLLDYGSALELLPARAFIQCHRRTERRIREILAGRGQAHDVEVVSL
jgi:hypothetical protein